MQGEKTDPSGGVNRILVWVIPLHGHVIRDVVNRDHPVGQDQNDKEENDECEVAQKVHGSLDTVVAGSADPALLIK